MAGKKAEFLLGNAVSSSLKRQEQIKAWENSETSKQPSTILPSRRVPSVKFGDNVVFFAATHSGDLDEVERLVRYEGADVNFVNKDGLTALHQCCIDDEFEMVKLLVKLNASVDIQDKEGWTPLHAAASCGNDHIVRFLLDHGAFPALVNNEGDLPIDLAEDFPEIIDMLKESVEKNMIDMEAVRGVEAELMLEDANRLKNDPTLKPAVGPGGATPLHVAASKDYLQVVKILVSLKASQVQVDAEDDDGWTPLHAAVYWAHFDIAEQLVAHGADLNKKTHIGDSVEDLCEPEYEDELNTLKKYGEQNNRRRTNAISQTKQRLIHSNSREDVGGKHSSPQIVRRRSSKERSLFPKIDIAKEREERESFTGSIGGEFNSESPPGSSVTVQVPDKNSPPSSHVVNQNTTPKLSQVVTSKPSNVTSNSSTFEARDVVQENDNSNKDARDTDKNSPAPEAEKSSPPSLLKPPGSLNVTTESPPSSDPSSAADSPSGSPTQKNKFSPKSNRKKYPGMSPKMLARVGQWETAATPPQRNASSGGRASLVPLASSTPSSNGDNLGTTPVTSETKRYSFQPKTISPSSSASSLPPRSMSVETRPASARAAARKIIQDELEVSSHLAKRRTSNEETNIARKQGSLQAPKGEYKASSLPWGSTTSPKRSYNQDDKGQLATPEGGYRASSLPRSSKISPSVSEPKVEEKGAKAVSTEAMATPSSHVDGTSFLSPKDRDGYPRDQTREVSVESNTSAGSRTNMDDSETSRKSRARKQRHTRKSTQPVPADLLEQLSKHDREMELVEELKSNSSSSVDDTTDGAVPELPKDSDSAEKKQTQRVTMSTYRPSARPTSHITTESAGPTWPPKPKEDKGKTAVTEGKAAVAEGKAAAAEPETEDRKKLENSVINIATKSSSSSSSAPSASSTTPTSTDTSHKSHARSKSMPSADACKEDSSTSPSMHPRTKSTTRRRPREKRRSTGIVTEAAEDEVIPEGLENLVRRSGGDGEAGKSSKVPDESPAILDNSGDLSGEVDSLRAQLEEEQSKSRKLEKEKGDLERELEESKAKNVALHRRYQDATRAYEQERRENEMKDVRLQEIQNHSKQLQELKHENQRMKDENSALIRVIGKLSRSPLPT